MEILKACIREQLNEDLINMNISGPRKGGGMVRYDLRPVMIRGRLMFQLEAFDGTQVYHENLEVPDLIDRLDGILPGYRNVHIRTTGEEIEGLISKKGRTSIRRKKKAEPEEGPGGMGQDLCPPRIRFAHNRTKRYILPEGQPVPFLIDLGVMNAEGKVVRKKYDKYRQINRFLEFIEDVLPALEDRLSRKEDREITILDFGCGKSYLTFAMYYYLHILKKHKVRIIGLDRKKKVIRDCRKLADQYGYDQLVFLEGNIEDYEGLDQVDMVVTLHACDTATDYALAKAVRWGAGVILSVPCCQHELNQQYRGRPEDRFAPLSDYGILKERFSALATDGIRAKMLEACGYRTQILEFIDMEHTPKNLLIRAILKPSETVAGKRDAKETEAWKARQEVADFCGLFGYKPAIVRLLEEDEPE